MQKLVYSFAKYLQFSLFYFDSLRQTEDTVRDQSVRYTYRYI